MLTFEKVSFEFTTISHLSLPPRDRVGPFWQAVRDHIYNICVKAEDASLHVERAVVGLLRVAIRLLCREDIAGQVLASLRVLLMMKPKVVHAVSRQVRCGDDLMLGL